MDLDADGHDDIITGSYWPGDIYIFRGLGEQEFEAGRQLTDAADKHLNAGQEWLAEDKPDLEGLASAPHAIDYDGDGDLDMLVGNIVGHVVLIPNEGSATEPSFHAEHRILLEADGDTIEVGGGDSGPTTTDWDKDGLWDLLVGAGDGAVWFYRNCGSATEPEFEAGEALIEARDLRKDFEFPPTHAGIRAKPHVVDYDGDGLDDLLIGDLHFLAPIERELSEEQLARRDELRAQLEKASAEFSGIIAEFSGDEETLNAVIEAHQIRVNTIHAELAEMQPRRAPTGYVWLYRRLPSSD